MKFLNYFWYGLKEMGMMIGMIGILVGAFSVFVILPVVGLMLFFEGDLWGIPMLVIWIAMIGYVLKNE